MEVLELVVVGVALPLLVAWILWASKTLIAIQRSVIGTQYKAEANSSEIADIWVVLNDIAPRAVQSR